MESWETEAGQEEPGPEAEGDGLCRSCCVGSTGGLREEFLLPRAVASWAGPCDLDPATIPH